jgi:hypothetical protein
MRFMIWSLGAMLLEAWHNILAELGRPVPWFWWGFEISWAFLGAAVGLSHTLGWVLRKYNAGALATGRETPVSAPAVIRKESL